MPKVKQQKRNSASKASPYADAAAKTKAANTVFKMNTDLGQHILKNPGVAQRIVDKAELKQSDVSRPQTWPMYLTDLPNLEGLFFLNRLFWKLVLVPVT